MQVGSLAVELEAKEDVRLPAYKGAVIRGAFGNAFRRVSCPFPRRECPNCLLKEKCVYSQVFETPRPPESKIMRKYETIPRPFVIEPPLHGTSLYTPGQTLAFGLVLIGPSIGYLPYFIYAFEEMASNGLGPGRGKLKVRGVLQDGKLLYDGSDNTVKSPVATEALTLKGSAKQVSALTIHFLSPVRIVYQGRIAQSLDFHVLFRSLVRRVGLLSYFYSEKPFEIDYRGLIAKAEKVKARRSHLEMFSWQRFSTRQERVIDLDGLIGEATYEGNLTGFMPYLKIGERVHVGKNTTFGLGKYEIRDWIA
jgi:hypothetical protein